MVEEYLVDDGGERDNDLVESIGYYRFGVESSESFKWLKNAWSM